MSSKIVKEQLIIPVYLNEKTVLDMLAIIEDGFSMLSEVSSVNQHSEKKDMKVSGGISTNSMLSKLLKIELNGNAGKENNANESTQSRIEKVHTNVSLLSKFRSKLINNNLLACQDEKVLDFSKIKSGDFIELEGQLQKNPMIDIMEKFIDVFRMIEIFSEKAELGAKKAIASKKNENNALLKQIKAFLEELKHTGTIDFILESNTGTLVLSAQEQYLSNDNISEIIGGNFKVLGKVIKVCNEDEDSINLLRKTTLNILNQDMLTKFMSFFKSQELEQFNLPELRFKIDSPSAIIIPVAIYS